MPSKLSVLNVFQRVVQDSDFLISKPIALLRGSAF